MLYFIWCKLIFCLAVLINEMGRKIEKGMGNKLEKGAGNVSD